MKIRARYSELKKHRAALIDYFHKYEIGVIKEFDSPKVFSMKQKLDLCGEITSVNEQVQKIERMAYGDTCKECEDSTIKVNSKINSWANPLLKI